MMPIDTLPTQLRLIDVSPELERLLLGRSDLPLPQFAVSDIKYEAVRVNMRDGVRLASDLYLPPLRRAPVIVMRTPYGRAVDGAQYPVRHVGRAGDLQEMTAGAVHRGHGRTPG